MIKLGVKTNTSVEQMADRLLKENIETLEFHLVWEDLLDLESLHEKIEYVFSKGIKNIVLHQPMKTSDGEWLNLGCPDVADKIIFSTTALVNLAKRFSNVKVLLHIVYSTTKDLNGYIPKEIYLKDVVKMVNLFKAYEFENYLVYENGVNKEYAFYNDDMIQMFKKYKMPICLDTSHDFISAEGNMDKLLKSLKELKPLIKHYHLVDSLGEKHDGLELSKGKIDWKLVKPLINPKATHIFEINLPDVMNCQPMVVSCQYLQNI